MVSNFEFTLEPGQALKSYMHHRKIVTVLLSLNLFYELCLLVYVCFNYDFIMAQLGEIYRNSTMGTIAHTFLACYVFDFGASAMAYGYGFYGLYTHKVKTYNSFNLFLLLCVFTKLVISYLNV